MAINKIEYPADLTTQSDFDKHSDLIEKRYLDQSAHPFQVRGGVIPQGTVLQIGGVVYHADADETISGTESDYVKVVPGGSTATAEYVDDLTGVEWNSQYNGYYDSSSPANLYLFNEQKAYVGGQISALRKTYIETTENGDVYVARNADIAGDLRNGSNNPDLIGGGRSAGFHLGTNVSDTDLPVGAVVIVSGTTKYSVNSIVDVYHGTFQLNWVYKDAGDSGEKLAGTWRVRGGLQADPTGNQLNFHHLAQRVA